MFALGVCTDAMDDYCRTSESTVMKCMKRFCVAVRAKFGEYHLRQPTRLDFLKQLGINSARGFPGMFASLDCMHYEWKKLSGCLARRLWKQGGQMIHHTRSGCGSKSIHMAHFSGLPGSNNELNVLDRSPLIYDMLVGETTNMTFEING